MAMLPRHALLLLALIASMPPIFKINEGAAPIFSRYAMLPLRAGRDDAFGGSHGRCSVRFAIDLRRFVARRRCRRRDYGSR